MKLPHRPHLPHLPRHYETDSETVIELPHHRRLKHDSEIDIAERSYRSRFQPSYREEIRVNESTVDAPRSRPSLREEIRVDEVTIDPPRLAEPPKEKFYATEEIVEPGQFQSNKMAIYDEEGSLPDLHSYPSLGVDHHTRVLGVLVDKFLTFCRAYHRLPQVNSAQAWSKHRHDPMPPYPTGRYCDPPRPSLPDHPYHHLASNWSAPVLRRRPLHSSVA